MTQPYRLDAGGIVDRAQPLRFTFDGVGYSGYAGDTLASALLASGVHLFLDGRVDLELLQRLFDDLHLAGPALGFLELIEQLLDSFVIVFE